MYSQVLQALKVAHRSWDSTIQVVAREIKCLELCKLANLCRDCAGDVVVLQETAIGKRKQKISLQSKRNHTHSKQKLTGNDKAIYHP